jgi:hypothetical protein
MLLAPVVSRCPPAAPAGTGFPSFWFVSHDLFSCTWKPCSPGGSPVSAGVNTSPYFVSLIVTVPAALPAPFSDTVFIVARSSAACTLATAYVEHSKAAQIH